MVKSYEAMFLVDPATLKKETNKVPDYISAVFSKYEVGIIQESKWAERTLSYSIKGQRRGTYYLTYFNSKSENIAKMTQEFELNPSILRFVILILDPAEKDKILSPKDKSNAQPLPQSEPVNI